MARAGAGGVKAAFRRVVACAVRATATCSRRRGHAAHGLYRWSATERRRLVHQLSQPSLTTSFAIELTENPWLRCANILNRIGRPMYQLQLLFNNRVLIPNQHRVKSIQSQADSTVSDQDLEKFVKC